LIEYVIMLHVLGAAVWTGGHLVLTLGFLPKALRERDPEPIRFFESRYERIGIPALLIQVVTGVVLAFHYLPSFSSWFTLDNHLSTHIVVKLALLLGTLGLALHARLRLIPNLAEDNLRYLAGHIVAVTVLSVLFVLVGVGVRTGGLF
jgi:putative copper export protein